MCLLAIATPAAFRASPNSTAAANVVGAMLTPWHYIAIAAPLLLLLLIRNGGAPSRLILFVLFTALLFAASEAMIDLRIRTIRTQTIRPISSLPATDPVRRRFGLLHGVSSLLLVAQAVAAAIAVGRDENRV